MEHFSFNCQEPGFVPIGTYKGQMVVSGSKFSPSGVLIEENDTNAIYLYDHKTKTFGDKLYQDPNYDVSGLTGSCRQASGGASNDRMSGEISSISYESLQPEKIFFNKKSELKNDFNGKNKFSFDNLISFSLTKTLGCCNLTTRSNSLKLTCIFVSWKSNFTCLFTSLALFLINESNLSVFIPK